MKGEEDRKERERERNIPGTHFYMALFSGKILNVFLMSTMSVRREPIVIESLLCASPVVDTYLYNLILLSLQLSVMSTIPSFYS